MPGRKPAPGARLYRAGLEGALKDVNRALELAPHSAGAYTDRGLIHLEQKQFAQAAADFTRTLEIRPAFGFALSIRSVASEMQGQRDRAAADYAAARRLNEGQAHFDRSYAYMLAERIEQSFADLNEGLRILPGEAWARLVRGDHYLFEKKDIPRALADYNKAVELAPKNSYAYYQRATAHDENDQLDRALDDLNQALRIDPDYVLARAFRAHLLLDKGEYTQAVRDCETALRHDAGCIDALVARGLAYAYWHEEHPAGSGAEKEPVTYEQAVADLTEANRLEPKFGLPLAARGACHIQKGQFAKAMRDLCKALEIDDRCDLAYFYRGGLHAQARDHDRAIADYTRALDLEPMNAEALLARGLLYLEKKEYTLARRDLDRAVELVPELKQLLPGGGR